MNASSLVVRTKLTPPRPHKRTLARPRLTQRLLEALDYRLTLVQGGAGYGKSTALAALAAGDIACVWYHLDGEDADPRRFLLHLLHGFRQVIPNLSEAPLVMLEEWERNGRSAPWPPVIDALSNALAEHVHAPLLLILDDAHRLGDAGDTMRMLDHLIGRAPANLHTILASRYPLKLPSLVAWRVKGQALHVQQAELSFTAAELAALCREQYGLTLPPAQIDLLVDKTEGWPIALPLVAQRLQAQGQTSAGAALADLSGSASDLFAYLAHEVLAQQPADIQAFLRITAVLRTLTPAICDNLRQAGDSEQILRYLLEKGLFVVDLGGGHLRYHHLFRDFLRHQLAAAAAAAAHRRAAACYQAQGNDDALIYHLLAARDYAAAADHLAEIGRRHVRQGRLDTLGGWIASLPPEELAQRPPLLVYLGDIARLHSRFDEALGWYQQAEARARVRGDARAIGQALRGQARVYLDTVNPSQAERLLEEALRLSDGVEDRESRARLLDLLAENLLNQGRSAAAQGYQDQARALRHEGPGAAQLPIRLLLRTGRLDEARRQLEAQIAAEEAQPVLRPRAHRETLLLLSLILAFQGEQEAAYRYALQGTQRGQALDAPFITAVGHMRQGHAHLLRKDKAGYAAARRCFQEAIALSDRLGVPRLKVEAMWGLCQAHGFSGELALAEQTAREGSAIAQSAGDEWVEACIQVTLGASYALGGANAMAAAWLEQAGNAFRECSDTYGEAVTRLWQCLVWRAAGDATRLERDLAALLQLAHTHGYNYLFTRRTLLGPPDPRALTPLLLFARASGRDLGRDGKRARGHGLPATVAANLLEQLGLTDLTLHPGYQLRIQTLGAFHLWRGADEVDVSAWQRKTARQLFLLLLTWRGRLLERDQICDRLWPDQPPDKAQRDFKAAFNALAQVLEPARGAHAPSAFILRDGTLYGLRPEADLWLDTAEFERCVTEGDARFEREPGAALNAYRQALALYQGEYLREYPYEEWCSEERERLLTLALRTAERLGGALADQEGWEEVIDVCNWILARDDCWEQAYRWLMLAYARLGNRAQALRVYKRCEERLHNELAIAPSPATKALYAELV
jgi:LuxR family transcriptional regulator, maltose regulon positive regulatory protein